MAKTNVNGIEIWYKRDGTGEVIAQIHGGIIGHINFAPVSPLLAENFEVLDFDMRGFGESSKPIQRYTVETWADDLAALLDALSIESAHVHGTSMGGLVGVQFAAKYPERLRGLVLDCTIAQYDRAAHINKRIWKALIDAYGFTDPYWDLLVTQCFSRSYVESERAEEGIALLKQSFMADSPPELYDAVMAAVQTADTVPLLSEIQAPTLIMIGDQDVLTPLEMGPSGAGAKVMQELIPNSKLAVLEGCGHINLFERPEQSARVITEFLQNVVAHDRAASGGSR